MIKLISRLKPIYTLRDWIAAINIFSKNPIKRYENGFSKKFENDYGVMFQHGRTGLYALLKVWGLDNDEIICPAYTCVVVPNAIVLSGNIPVFVDCACDSFNMDIQLLEEAITEKTRAIVVTHLFGYPMNVIKIRDIIRNAENQYGHKIYVIQDVAHSYGARWQGELITQYGDAAIFGSNISKIINSIFGGMVITNSPDTYQKLIEWRQNHTIAQGWKKELKRFVYFVAVNIAFNPYVYGLVNWLERKGLLDRFVKYYEEDKIFFPSDWDYMPSAIEARVGLSQLGQYEQIVQTRTANSKQWIEVLKDEKIKFIPEDEGCTYSHCVGLVDNRDEWLEKYRLQGIQLGILIEYSIPYMKAYQGYRKLEYPVSLKNSHHTVNFPNWYKGNQ